MTSALLNIAGKIDPQTAALFEMVSCAVADLDMPYGELGALNLERLVEEMCEYIDIQYDRNQQLLSAFMAGFLK